MTSARSKRYCASTYSPNASFAPARAFSRLAGSHWCHLAEGTREQIADLGRQRRRAHRLGQDPQAGALKRLLGRERRPDRPEKRRPRTNLAEVGERLRAIGIVEAEHRGLREDVGRAEAAGMQRVAFDLRRASLVAFDEQPGRDAAERHRGRVEERLLPGTSSSGWRT